MPYISRSTVTSETACRALCSTSPTHASYSYYKSSKECYIHRLNLPTLVEYGFYEENIIYSNSNFNSASKDCPAVYPAELYKCGNYSHHHVGKFIDSSFRIHEETKDSLPIFYCHLLCSFYHNCRSVAIYSSSCILYSVTIDYLEAHDELSSFIHENNFYTTHDRFCGDLPYDPDFSWITFPTTETPSTMAATEPTTIKTTTLYPTTKTTTAETTTLYPMTKTTTAETTTLYPTIKTTTAETTTLYPTTTTTTAETTTLYPTTKTTTAETTTLYPTTKTTTAETTTLAPTTKTTTAETTTLYPTTKATTAETTTLYPTTKTTTAETTTLYPTTKTTTAETTTLHPTTKTTTAETTTEFTTVETTTTMATTEATTTQTHFDCPTTLIDLNLWKLCVPPGTVDKYTCEVVLGCCYANVYGIFSVCVQSPAQLF